MKSIRKPNRKIPELEQIKLWTKSGGRCAICNEYLLKDSLTGRIFNFGEKAHNIGVGSGKSPRSSSDLTAEERNREENLLLLCPKHHKMIDAKKFTEEFRPEKLRVLKDNHERRIVNATRLGNNDVSVVLRMTNRIKKHSIAISDEEVRQALDQCENKFPQFLLTTDNNVEVNLAALAEPINRAYWKAGCQIIDEKISKQLEPKADEKDIKHISIFALARIPLLIYLGYRLGDKIPISVYQKQRNDKEDWIWCQDKKSVTFTNTCLQKGSNRLKVVVLASISGKIHSSHLPKSITSVQSIYEIAPSNEEPNRDIINSKETLNNFKNSYQRLLRLIEKENPNAKEILLFPALPVSAAVYVGRELLIDTSPNLTIYDRDGNNYIKTFSINTKKEVNFEHQNVFRKNSCSADLTG